MNNDFVRVVNSLNLKFPIAEIANKTGQNHANVSRYLSGKTVAPEAFIISFCEAFGIDYDKEFKEYKIFKQQTADELINSIGGDDNKAYQEIRKKIASVKKTTLKEYKDNKRTNSRFFFESMLPALGFKQKGDIGYKDLVEKLRLVVNEIMDITGATAEEISMKVYKKDYTIKNSLEGGWISPNMTKHLLKTYNLNFEEIERKSDANAKNAENTNKHIGKPYFIDFKEAVANNFSSSLAYSYINLPYAEVDIFANVPNNISSTRYDKGDILGLRKVNKEVIKPNSYYLLEANNADVIIKRIQPKNSKTFWTFDDDEQIAKSDIELKDIKNIYEITALIRFKK